MIHLICRCRGISISYTLRDGDEVEVWVGNRMIGEAPAELILEIIGYHFRGVQLLEEVRLSAVPPRKPLAPAIQGKQLDRAEARRRRRV